MNSTDMEHSTEETTLRHFVDLPRFGPFHYTDSETITFPFGIPGFENLREYIILSVPETNGYLWLQSLERLETALPMVDPWAFFPEYQPIVPSPARLALAIEEPKDFAVLSIVTVERGGGTMYLNLLAPIIINLSKRLGAQVILDKGAYSHQTPVPKPPETQDV